MAAPTAGRPRPFGGLDETLEWFDRFSLSLVRLEPFSLDEVRRSVERFGDAVNDHLVASRATSRRPATGPGGSGSERLELEHERFRASIAELNELLAVVERDDHGGHRQALGQYGRIFAEALRVHRGEELATGPRSAAGRVDPPGRGARGNHN